MCCSNKRRALAGEYTRRGCGSRRYKSPETPYQGQANSNGGGLFRYISNRMGSKTSLPAQPQFDQPPPVEYAAQHSVDRKEKEPLVFVDPERASLNQPPSYEVVMKTT